MIENPTQEQRSKIKGIIYMLTNTINNKKYIGQTINSFYKRYRQNYKWWEYASSKYLENALKFYGHENFSVTFLEININSAKKLAEMEKYYAKLYNTYAPNGYNLRECGDLHGKHHELTLQKRRKYYIFKSPDNKIHETVNISKLCEENKLDRCHMYKVANKTRKQHKGWTLINTNLQELKIKSPEGEIFNLKVYYGSLPQFCKKHNIKDHTLYAILYQDIKACNGWSLLKQ